MDIKITKKLLDSHYKRKKKIPVLEAELEELLITDKGMGNSVILNYQTWPPIPETIVGFDVELYRRRKATLEHEKARVVAVENWINAIDDGQTRYVFKMFYVNGMRWGKIAQKIGYKDSPDYPRLHIRDSYLKKCGIK